ncbi:uncharacterized protein CEXT_244301, partial [Caerostris extrusa]
KAVRATLVLVPLFGLHFFLVLYQPQSGQCVTLESYTFLSYAMDGLQGFLVSLIFLLSEWRNPGFGAPLGAADASAADLHLVVRVAALHSLGAQPGQDGGARETRSCEAFSLCEAVTDLMRRSVYRMRLRYSMNTKPSSVTLSNLSDLPATLTKSNQNSESAPYNARHTLKRDSYSIEEISDVF